RRRVVQQLERRQLVRLGRFEQLHLFLFLDALALRRRRRRRIDAWRRARRGLFLLDDHGFLARLLAFAALRDVTRGGRAAAKPADALPRPGPDAVDDREPRDAEGEREACHPGGEQEQRGAQELEARGQPVPDQGADDATGGLPQRLRIPVQ